MTKTVATVAHTDGKKDKFPSRHRVAFVFHTLHEMTLELFEEGVVPSAPHAAGLEKALVDMSEILERVEFLALTVLPITYAQLARLTTVIFLTVVPVAASKTLNWGTIGLSFVVNIIYFSIDEVAAQMEMPFGRDAGDIDLEKLIRRVDKHTAAQLSLFLGRPCPNFDLFPETRKTGVDQHRMPTYKKRRMSVAERLADKAARGATQHHGVRRCTAEIPPIVPTAEHTPQGNAENGCGSDGGGPHATLTAIGVDGGGGSHLSRPCAPGKSHASMSGQIMGSLARAVSPSMEIVEEAVHMVEESLIGTPTDEYVDYADLLEAKEQELQRKHATEAGDSAAAGRLRLRRAVTKVQSANRVQRQSTSSSIVEGSSSEGGLPIFPSNAPR